MAKVKKAAKNPIAKALSLSMFKKKVVKPKRGKGAYSRKGKAPKAV